MKRIVVGVCVRCGMDWDVGIEDCEEEDKEREAEEEDDEEEDGKEKEEEMEGREARIVSRCVEEESGSGSEGEDGDGEDNEVDDDITGLSGGREDWEEGCTVFLFASLFF